MEKEHELGGAEDKNPEISRESIIEVNKMRTPRHNRNAPVFCYACNRKFNTHQDFRSHLRIDHDVPSLG